MYGTMGTGSKIVILAVVALIVIGVAVVMTRSKKSTRKDSSSGE
ncbi:hypothetical protein QFZ63_005119 [Streptomyces sp. B3I7]|nr:hypothetical protein [Streptomyces sp. B3I7]MDQ0813405.1 hypothetical protein [Streptomyces sp. B3I7]